MVNEEGWYKIDWDPKKQSITMKELRDSLYCDWGNEDRTSVIIAQQQQENKAKLDKITDTYFNIEWWNAIDPEEQYFKKLYIEQQKQTRRDNMATNYSTILFAFNKKLRAVKVKYAPNETASYTYKTLDQSIKVDDYVVIPTDSRHKMTVGQVCEVDVLMDIESDIEYKWIIDRVDKEAHDTVLKGEEEIVVEIKQSEANARLKQIQENMVAFKSDKLKTMALVDLSEPTKE